MTRGPVPAVQEVVSYMTSLSNWDRWGRGDALGTLNYVTASVRSAAFALATGAAAISLSWDVEDMTRQTRVFGDPGVHVADQGEPSRALIAMEDVAFQFHGHNTTHLDALSHMFWEGKAYGGAPLDSVTEPDGAVRYPVTTASDGIVTRGVLLDLPSVVGELPLHAVISPSTLEEAERAHGVTVRSGDALLVRTGYGRLRAAHGLAGWQTDGRPGLDPRCLPWLHERQVALLGSDATHDPEPLLYSAMPAPVHTVGIVAMGLWLLDNANVEALAEACRAANRYEFLFTLAPLRLVGATGSPVNPLAFL